MEEQGSCRLNPREKKLEEGDRCSRVSSGKVGEDGGFSRRDSRRIGEDLGPHRSVSQERVRGHDGHRQSSPWVAVRGDSGQRGSDAGPNPRDSRRAVSEDGCVGVPEARGPRTSDSGDRGSSDDLSGFCEGVSVDGSHCPSSFWGGVSDDLSYEASDASRVSIREDASRRLSGFWERESEEDSRFRSSWERREDRGPPANDEEFSCCSSSDPCVGASEDRRSSRGLGSTPPQSPSPRAKNCTMPHVANSGPSKSSRETADSCESHTLVVIPCLGHKTFPT